MPIPDLVWSGMVGTLCGGLVTVIGLWDGRRRLKIQLAHDARLKAIDREVGMRKDAYSKVSEDIAGFEEYVANSLVRDDPAKPEFFACRAKLSASLARAAPFASSETTLAGAELLGKYASAMPALIEAARPCYDTTIEILGHRQKAEAFGAERNRILEQLRAELDSGSADHSRVERLNRSFDSQAAAATKAWDELNAAMKHQTKAIAAYLDVGLDFVCECEPLKQKFRQCMQVDLGIIIDAPDETRMRQLRNSSLAAARKSIGRLFGN